MPNINVPTSNGSKVKANQLKVGERSRSGFGIWVELEMPTELWKCTYNGLKVSVCQG